MLDPARTLFGQFLIDAQHLDKKLFESIVAPDHVQGDVRPLSGQADGFVGGIVDKPFLGKGPEGLGNGGAADVEDRR